LATQANFACCGVVRFSGFLHNANRACLSAFA
jgi:hypothetical protein